MPIRPSDTDSIRTLALIEAIAAINGLTPTATAVILAKAQTKMTAVPNLPTAAFADNVPVS